MSRESTALIVIDVQEKLLPAMSAPEPMLEKIRLIIEAAAVLNVRCFFTEQYPRGLGPTVSGLIDAEQPTFEKTMFSCRECTALTEQLVSSKIRHVLLVGIETHVCVAQSAMDLMTAGYSVCVALDGVGSRSEIDYAVALDQLQQDGVRLTTVEAAIFQWCETASAKEFKQISRLVR